MGGGTGEWMGGWVDGLMVKIIYLLYYKNKIEQNKDVKALKEIFVERSSFSL